jgi:hypothetical protein
MEGETYERGRERDRREPIERRGGGEETERDI